MHLPLTSSLSKSLSIGLLLFLAAVCYIANARFLESGLFGKSQVIPPIQESSPRLFKADPAIIRDVANLNDSLTLSASTELSRNNRCFENLADNVASPPGPAFSTALVSTDALASKVTASWTTTKEVGGGNAYPIEMRVRVRTYDPQSQPACGGMGATNFNDGILYSDPIGLPGQPNHTYAIEQIGARQFQFKDL